MARKSTVEVSVLVLNYNGIDFTRSCIRSLRTGSCHSTEIILVDNGSLPEEVHMLRKLAETNDVKLILLPRNAGYAEGMNIAYRNSRGRYVVFINNDMRFDPEWIPELLNVLKSHPHIGAVQPKVRDIRRPGYFEYSLAAGGMLDYLGYPFARGRMFVDVEKDSGQYDLPVYICWAGILMVRKPILERIGVFDPMFFHNMEDIDLCMRIWGSGYRIAYAPKSIVYHYGGAVIARDVVRKAFYVHRNNLIMILKNWPGTDLARILIPRIALDGVAMIHYVRSGAAGMALSVLKAYISILVMLPGILKSRTATQALIRRDYFFMMPMVMKSLIWNYFVRKIRTYGSFWTDTQFYVRPDTADTVRRNAIPANTNRRGYAGRVIRSSGAISESGTVKYRTSSAVPKKRILN